MTPIKISTSLLREYIERLRQLVEALRALLEEFDAAVEALAAQWEGEARDAFVEAAKRDRDQIEIFIQVILQFIRALLEIARRYDEAEQHNFDLALERKR